MEMGKIDERKKGPQGGSLPSPWSGGIQVSSGRRCRKISLNGGGWAFAWGAGWQGCFWRGLQPSGGDPERLHLWHKGMRAQG